MITQDKTLDKYTADGTQVAFPVTYPIYAATDVTVTLGAADGTETVLTLDTDYSVAISASGAGGTVTLAAAPAAGVIVAIALSLPLVQMLDLSSTSTIDVNALEREQDKQVQMIQQLDSKLGRAVLAPVTSGVSGRDLYTVLLQAAADAVEAAQQAQAQAESLQQQVLAWIGVLQQQTAAGSAAIAAEGDRQAARLESIVDLGGLAAGVACAEGTWTLTAAVAVGDVVPLPEGIQYVVGRHHILLSYDGVVMSPTWFDEVGDEDTLSTQVRMQMPFRAGQELHVWVSPLGKAETLELAAQVTATQAALAELSRQVVYADAGTEA